MKCSRCGEKYKNNQVFCMKCGLPLQVVPDFNLIEAELADSVGEVLNREKLEEEYNRNKDSLDKDVKEEIYATQESGAVKKNEETQDELLIAENGEKKEQGKRKKKKMIIGSIIGGILVLIVAAAVIMMILENKNSFAGLYKQGTSSYQEGSYQSALEKFLEAQKLADTDEQKIKVKEALWDTYVKLGNKDTEIIEILKELIKLAPAETKYYTELMQLYRDNHMQEDIDTLINSLDNEELYEVLSAYAAPLPSASIESGEYDKYFSVELSAFDGAAIYYTLDGSEPNQESELYSGPVEIKTEGETVLKAIAVNSKGVSSSVLTQQYTIILSVLSAPEVSPASGSYTVDTKITVTSPENAKIYYTLDGSQPTKSSSLYTDPVDMPRGNNVFKAVAINNAGAVSQVVTNIYDLNITPVYSVEEAVNMLKQWFIESGKMSDENGNSAKGYKYNFKYLTTAIIENNEYYIIKTDFKDDSGNVKETGYYGVDIVSGTFKKVSADSKGKYFITN